MATEILSTTTRTDSHVFRFPELIESGTYPGIYRGSHVVSYIDKATKDPGELLVWAFELPSDDPEEPRIVEGASSLLLSARSKGFAWLRAIAPDVVRAREEIDAAELDGRPCLVVVETSDEGDTKVVDVLAPVR